ncbi:MAG: DUF882 domain-containing protein [Hyphomicrobiaceae bacterium]
MAVARDIGERRRRGYAPLAAVLALCLIIPAPLGANGARTIALYNIHTKETLRIVYKRNGRYVPAAMQKLNWHLRDWRQNKPTKMDPALIDLMWEIHTELGSRVPVHVISGYRSPKTNNMLRKTRGGQARRSQHLLGRAVDVRFPDIPVRRLRYSALLREQGGVGYYPTSATPFVHIDTGRVRHWPRMGRQELALLFPHGRTRHRPRRGGAITRKDAITARASNPILARRVAAFHDLRRSGPLRAGPARTRLASASRPFAVPPPRLVQRPRIARRPAIEPAPRPLQARLAPGLSGWQSTTVRRPPPPRLPVTPALVADAGPKPLPFRPTRQPEISPSDRSLLTQLASAVFGERSAPRPPRNVRAPNADEWISAPAYDEEHPEEMFYRPFPIAPYITATASFDDPALRRLKHPDIDKTLALLVADGTDDPPLQIRPGLRIANLMWSQSFRGWPDGRQPMVARADHPPALGRRLVKVAER